MFVIHESTIHLNCRVQIIKFVYSGLWIVATSDFMVCEDKSDMQGEVVVHPLLGVINREY